MRALLARTACVALWVALAPACGDSGPADVGSADVDTAANADAVDPAGPDAGGADTMAPGGWDTGQPGAVADSSDTGPGVDPPGDVQPAADAVVGDAGQLQPDPDAAALDETSDAAPAYDAADTAAAGPVEPAPSPHLACDAGDEAWVKRTLTLLLGRRPAGIREVRALEQMVQQTSRATVARGLMADPLFIDRWADFLMDELRINRVGDKAHPDCYGAPLHPDDTGQVARFVRDNPPDESSATAPFNMTDVLRSSLALDDLSPLYRSHLFAMMAKPITGANVAALEMDITRRQDFGEIFEAVYLHRNVVCSGCHNSTWGITDHVDPAKDRHWPLPGRFEEALYGAATGAAEMEFYSTFRRLGVHDKDGTRPWKMAPSCGEFRAEADIESDPAEVDAFFIEPLGKTANVWQVERALRKGFDSLRATGALAVDETTGAVDGYEGFAYLVSVRIVTRVWREVFGYPLTVVHYFPRNQFQRDILLELSQAFVAERWSLRGLLTRMVTHPLYNEPAPVDGCGADHPFVFPPVFDPWVTAEDEETARGNSPGDLLHRHGARVLLAHVAQSLEWPGPAAYPGSNSEENFQKAVGVFVKDAEPGFAGVDFQGLLTWENRYGACELPNGVDADWLTLLVASALAADSEAPVEEPLTVRDVVAALKDRLLTAPALGEGEAELIAALFGAESVDTPLADVADWPTRARNLCGVLLASPQFMLAGIAPADEPAAPALVVGDDAVADHCGRWAPVLFDPDEWTVACEGDSVIVTPFAPPLGLGGLP